MSVMSHHAPHAPHAAIAIRTATSLSFLRAVFRAYDDRETFVIAGSRDAADRLPGLRIDRFVAVGDESGWFDETHPLIFEDGQAQISFTSGTTGTPKGILLRYDALADTIQRLNDTMQLSPEVREYVGVPASYSFGLARFRAIAAVGGGAFVPSAGFDPLEIARMLQSGDINALSAVPTLLRILIDNPDLIGAAGRRLRWMEIGSQHMTGHEKEAIKAIFPEARIIQHYGLTEASRTTFLDISQVEGKALESVGRPVGSTEIAIGDDDRIRIRGPHVARRWIDADGAHPLIDADGWLTTNDLGAIEDGYLYFHGRADDLINCGGIKLVPDVIEERLRIALRMTGGIAVARVPDKSRGDGILVAVENAQARALDDVRASAKAIVAEFGLSPGSALNVIEVDTLPVTATGKIQRRALAQAAEGALASPLDEDDAPSGDDHSLSAAIGRVLGMAAIPADASFVTLGGDSLNYVQASILIDERLGYLPDRWEQIPIAALERLTPAGRGATMVVDSSVVVRAFAILLVVLDHAWANAAGGAAIALMLVAGQNFARFQLPKIFQGRSLGLLTSTFWRVMVPYLGFVTLTLAFHDRMFWPQYLLFSNFTQGVYSAAGDKLLVPYWFLEDYLLYVLAFTVVISFGPVRTLAARRPWPFALGLFLLFLLVGIVASFRSNMPIFYPQSPFTVGWIFALGWLIFQADSRPRKHVARGTAIAAFAMMFAIAKTDGALFAGPIGSIVPTIREAIFLLTEALAVSMLIDVRSVKLPNWLARAASTIASASLYIYMCHPAILHFISQHGPLKTAIPAVIVSALVGIGIWLCVGLAERMVRGLGRSDEVQTDRHAALR